MELDELLANESEAQSRIVGPDGVTPASLYYARRDALDDETLQFKRGAETRGAALNSRNAMVAVEAIYKCVTIISSWVSRLPRRIVRIRADGSEETLPGHWLAKKLSRPMPGMSGKTFIYGTVMQQELTGMAFWWPRGTDRGQLSKKPVLAQLELLPSHAMRARRDRVTGQIVAWTYTALYGTETRQFEFGELVTPKYYNPDDPDLGLAPLWAAMRSARTDVKAAAYSESFFDNSATPSTILIYRKGRLTPVQRAQEEKQFTERYAGAKNAGRVATLSGDWDLKQLSLTQEDMQLLETRRDLTRKIGMVYGVPGIFLGNPNDSNFATANVEWQFLAEQTCKPKAEELEEILTERIVERFAPEQDLAFRFDYSSAPGLRADVTQQAATAKAWFDMGATYNDVVKLTGVQLPEQPWGDTWWKNFSLEDVNAIEPEPEDAPEDDDDDAGDSDGDAGDGDGAGATDDDAADDDDDDGRGAPAIIGHRTDRAVLRAGLIEDATRDAYWRAWIRRLAPPIARMQSKLRRYFYEIRQEILDNLAQLAEAGTFPSSGSDAKAIALAATRGKIDLLAQILFDRTNADEQLRKLVAPGLRESIEMGADQALAELHVEEGFTIESSPEGSAAFTGRLNKIVGVNETLWFRLNSTLEDGLNNGESISEMAARISAELNNAAQRARTIARTEVGTAVQKGRQIALAQEGVEKHEWLSSRDNEVRGSDPKDRYSHLIDGEIARVGEEFSVGLKFPLDDDGSGAEAGNVINCLPGDQRVSGAVLGASKAFYAGPIVEIETVGGHRLTVTVNHPVLTPRGMIPAGALRECDDILCEPIDIHGRAAHWDIKDQDRPPTIEQVFEALAAKGTRRSFAPGGRDFYGDGRFFKREVEVVTVPFVPVGDGMLERERESVALTQYEEEVYLMVANLPAGYAAAMLAATMGSPRRAQLAANGIGILTQASPLQCLGLTGAAGPHSRVAQTARDDLAVRAELLGQGEHAHASLERSNNSRIVDRDAPGTHATRLGATADLQPRLANPGGYSVGLHANFAAELQRRYAGRIAADRIRLLRRRDFLGPVYDLHTEQGYFAAGANATAIVRNCRCTTVPDV